MLPRQMLSMVIIHVVNEWLISDYRVENMKLKEISLADANYQLKIQTFLITLQLQIIIVNNEWLNFSMLRITE